MLPLAQKVRKVPFFLEEKVLFQGKFSQRNGLCTRGVASVMLLAQP